MKTRFEKYLENGISSISLLIKKLSKKDLNYIKRNFVSDEPWNSNKKYPKSIEILMINNCIYYTLFDEEFIHEYELFKKLKGNLKDKLK